MPTPAANALHSNLHVGFASRVVASSLHLRVHLPPSRSPLSTRALHTALHLRPASAAVYAGAPFTYPGGFPAAFVPTREFELHLLGTDGHDFGTLTLDRDRELQVVKNDVGNGQVKVMLDNPMLPLLTRGRVLSAYLFGLPEPVFDFLIEPGTLNLKTNDEGAGNGKVIGGRGTLALFDQAVVHPRDSGGPPVEKTVVINFSHPAYDHSAWVAATVIADQGNNPTTLWKGLPAGWLEPSAEWIWSSDGSAADAPGPVLRWFVYDFDITPGVYVWYSAGDNAYEAFLNGTKFVSAGDLIKTTGAFWKAQRTPIYIPAGANVLGIKGQNYTATVVGANPAGMLGMLRGVASDGIETTVIFYTDGTWLTFPDLSDGAFPGVTIGMALIWLIEQAQLLGGLEHVSWDFTALLDSNGNAWDFVESISVDVGSTLLKLMLQFCKDGRCDLRMKPGTRTLQAFRPGEMVPTSSVSFDDPGTSELSFSESPGVVNAYLVQHAAGYFTVEDAASIAANGRIESYITVGNADLDEAFYRANAQLALTKDAAAAQITVRAHPSILGFRDYGVGSIVPTLQEDGATVDDERVTSITVTEQGDQVIVIPTLRDLLVEEEDRFQAWLQSVAPGFLSGTFLGKRPPEPPDMSALTTASDGEIIHQQGTVTIEESPRHPIRRTGTASMTFLFLGGLLASTNVVADIKINDVYVTTVTIVAGQRRSPLVVFNPPFRVIEHDDWWTMDITGGSDGSELQAHLIIG